MGAGLPAHPCDEGLQAGAYEFTRPYWDDISDLAKQVCACAWPRV